MTRDNRERANLYAWADDIEVTRLALNMDQVERYRPPPNPAKLTDSRVGGYLAKYGPSSWELDALEPRVIDELVRDAIKKHIDADKWNVVAEQENEARQALKLLGDNWPEIRNYVLKNFGAGP